MYMRGWLRSVNMWCKFRNATIPITV